jgi:hypothetical protein
MIRAPFPWFGGKAKAAGLIWSRLGHDIGTFVEPFAGSCAVALNRPVMFDGWITLNDIDGNISNFWRSMKMFPDVVAEHATDPSNECDLHARHLWLVNNAERMTARLMSDPEYCEPKTAGWYAWGACVAISGGFCSGSGPWVSEPDNEGFAMLRKSNVATSGITKSLLDLNAGRGVRRKVPSNMTRLEWLNAWFTDLSALLESARVACGSWERILTPNVMTLNGIAGILLDPPYSLTGAVYANDSSTISGDVRQWCIENGDNPELRIALCGHAGEGHEHLESIGWWCESWEKGGNRMGKDDRERIWFSPHCIPPANAVVTGGLFA